MISKIEHGIRGLVAASWRIADDLCRAEGVLVAEHSVLAQAEKDSRDRCRTHRRHTQRPQTRTPAPALQPLISPICGPPQRGQTLPRARPQNCPDAGNSVLAVEHWILVGDELARVGGKRDVNALAFALLLKYFVDP